MKIPSLFLGCTAALFALWIAPARAGTILYTTDFNSNAVGHTGNFTTTTFDYANGPLIGQDSWLITGTSIVSPIAVANAATNGNVSLVNTGQDVNRLFTPASTSGSIFLSADITLTAVGSGDYFLHLGDGGTANFYDRIYAKTTTGGFLLGTAVSAATAVYGTTVLSLNTTYHIVAQYDFVSGATNDTVELYVNPVDPIYGGGADVPYITTTGGTDAASISSVNLRQGGGSGAPAGTIDNIAVATIAAAPEPTTTALMGLALGGLGLRRRR